MILLFMGIIICYYVSSYYYNYFKNNSVCSSRHHGLCNLLGLSLINNVLCGFLFMDWSSTAIKMWMLMLITFGPLNAPVNIILHAGFCSSGA